MTYTRLRLRIKYAIVSKYQKESWESGRIRIFAKDVSPYRLRGFESLRLRRKNYMNNLIIFGSKYVIFISLLISGIYFLYQPWDKKKNMLIFGITTVILVGILALVMGHYYYDPRPFVVGNFTPLIPHAPDNGFPSDHVLLASSIAIVLSFYNRKIALSLWILTVIIAICRVLSGVHHPIDVVGSIVISILGGSIAYIGIKEFNKKKNTGAYSKSM